MSAKKLLALSATAGPAGSTACKFDGANDHLARGADLTSNADAKSGIFSAWVRLDGLDASAVTIYSTTGTTFDVSRNASNKIIVTGRTSGGTTILSLTSASSFTVAGRFCHILAAWDLNATTGRLYVDDVLEASSGTLTNNTIDYTVANHSVGALVGGAQRISGALQHLYFAPGQYLDLSIAANRRKFTKYLNGQLVPENLGTDGSTPTGTAPAVYLPLTDPATAGVNKGTGGNFTLSGALEKASTSPDDASVEAVEYDGSTAYLSRSTALTGAGASVTSATVSCWVKRNSTGIFVVFGQDSANYHLPAVLNTGKVYFQTDGGELQSTTTLQLGRWYHILFSHNGSAAQCYIDDVAETLSGSGWPSAGKTWQSASGVGAYSGGTGKQPGEIAELFVAPGQYLDLSVEANRRKFITADKKPTNPRQLHLNTGITPAIYLPNPAATVEQNLGSGGNFTRNGTLKDARSTPVYYYAEPAKFDGVNDYALRGGNLTGASDSGKVLIAAWAKFNADGSFLTLLRGETANLILYRNASNQIAVQLRNSSGTDVCSGSSSNTYTAASGWVHILFSCDTALGVEHLYVNDVLDEGTFSRNASDIYFSGVTDWGVGARPSGATQKFNGDMAELFFAPGQYLDLSIESNRRKFITADKRPAGNLIQTTGITPAIYLARDYANWHTNLGSGGDFTVTGALERGTTSPSDVKI